MFMALSKFFSDGFKKMHYFNNIALELNKTESLNQGSASVFSERPDSEFFYILKAIQTLSQGLSSATIPQKYA